MDPITTNTILQQSLRGNPRFSIVTAAYNIVSMGFDWRDNITNWYNFLQDCGGQIVVACNTSTDATVASIKNLFTELKLRPGYSQIELTLIETSFDYGEIDFDGKIKNAAYKAAKENFCICLDLDEVVPYYSRDLWYSAANSLAVSPDLDALLIPSIDLHGSWDSYSKVGAKWYLVKNKPEITRGIPNFARKENGKMRVDLSDSTEFLRNGELIKSAFVLRPDYPEVLKLNDIEMGMVPFVFHRGYETWQQRFKQNSFWLPHWRNRSGEEVKDVMMTEEAYNKVMTFKHRLPYWNQEGAPYA